MGLTNVLVTVKNPQKPEKKFTGEFLVDSGATFTVLPARVLKNLGIKPKRQETFSLADGTTIKRNIGNALYEYQGIESAAPVLFGQKGDAWLLGAFTLGALGLTLDPLQRSLHKAMLRM